ncbi:MAG: PEGA domain-containing protein [Vicinamibacterales bacterium]
MKPHIGSFAVALITAIALTSTPATAQHRGGHSGGGRVSTGVMHRGIHVGAGRQMSTGRMVYGRAVPRRRVTAPHVHRHGTVFVPSHRRHLSVPGFALGIGVGAYRYPYGYYPYSFGYYPYDYSYYPYSYRYPAYYGYSAGYSGESVRGGYASLRIVDVPRGAEVYVDGSNAGLVDNSDGIFQLVDLLPGSHHIEIRAPGFEPTVFEVRAAGGDTITYRARMNPY